MTKRPVHPFRFIDLFSGLGGFHVALEELGGDCVFAAEIQRHLQILYEANFGIYPANDIRTIPPKDIPCHDLLCAGFPCQPFSKAGEQLGFECTQQGDLFFVVAAVLQKKLPNYFILENVPNLLTHNSGRTFAKIKETLEGLGYSISTNRYSPHQFGVPQIRERIYIVGSLKGLDDFDWPETTSIKSSITEVLEDNPSDARTLSEQVYNCISTWDDFLRKAPASIEFPSFPIWSMEFGANYPYLDETPYGILQARGTRGLTRYKGSHGIPLRDISPATRWSFLPSHAKTEQVEFPKWKKAFIRHNRNFYEDNKKWIDPWLPQILKFPSSLQKLEWNAKGGERNIWKYVLQFRASGLRVKRPTTAPSLIAMTGTQIPIIGWEKRYMTPRECARLQSLEGLQLPVSSTQAFRALGNAVNSKVVKAIVSKLLSREKIITTHLGTKPIY